MQPRDERRRLGEGVMYVPASGVVCPSVRMSVSPYVCPSFRLSVRRSAAVACRPQLPQLSLSLIVNEIHCSPSPPRILTEPSATHISLPQPINAHPSPPQSITAHQSSSLSITTHRSPSQPGKAYPSPFLFNTAHRSRP